MKKLFVLTILMAIVLSACGVPSLAKDSVWKISNVAVSETKGICLTDFAGGSGQTMCPGSGEMFIFVSGDITNVSSVNQPCFLGNIEIGHLNGLSKETSEAELITTDGAKYTAHFIDKWDDAGYGQIPFGSGEIRECAPGDLNKLNFYFFVPKDKKASTFIYKDLPVIDVSGLYVK